MGAKTEKVFECSESECLHILQFLPPAGQNNKSLRAVSHEHADNYTVKEYLGEVAAGQRSGAIGGYTQCGRGRPSSLVLCYSSNVSFPQKIRINFNAI